MTDNNIQDPRTQGVQGLKGLKGIDKIPSSTLQFIQMAGMSPHKVSQAFSPMAEEPIGKQLVNVGYGKSQYDEDIQNMFQLQDINEYRAQIQPWYSQLANGALKMLTTAGTILADNTIGLLVGTAQGISNLADDNPKTGFWSGVWNNDFTNAMADIQEKMEEIAPNYMTNWEQNAAFYERMFSGAGAANFWGNDIMKNAGFTIGSIASLYLTGGVANALKLGNLVKGAGNLGKFAKWTANTFISSIGESSLEALMTYRDNKKLMENNLNYRTFALQQDIKDEFQDNITNGMSEQEALAIYNQKMEQLNSDKANYQETMEADLINASNAVLAANMAALSVSNNLTLGSMIRGGYGNAKSLLDKAVKTVDGKAVSNTSTKDIAEGMLKGTLKFEAPQIESGAAKVGAHWAATSIQEGLEEGVQNMASTVAQMNTQARMNKWARENSSLGSMINPDADEELANITKAIGAAYEDQFGSANGQGWTEVAAGFITGALGVAGIHRNKQGKIRPTWQGGIKESYETIYGERGAIQEQIDKLNTALTSGKFGERAKNAAQNLAIKAKQDKALYSGDIRTFKNAETEMLVNDALYARDMGLLDSYLEMFNQLSENISDEDIKQLRALASNLKGDSAIDGLTDDEVKQRYQEKAQTTKAKIEEALKQYDLADKQYGNNFSEENRREAIREITYQNTLLWDTYRRMEDIQKDIDKLQEKKDNSTATVAELTELNVKQKDYQSLQKQANNLRDQLNEIKTSPQKLDEKITELKERRSKIQQYKEAQNAINKYKEATTLGEISEIYALSPEDTREQTLNNAIQQAEDTEVKQNLTQFRDYVSDVGAMETLIDNMFPTDNIENLENLSPEEERQILKNLALKRTFSQILNNIVDDMLNDETPTLNRQTLKDRLLGKIKEFEESAENAKNRAKGIKYVEDNNESYYDMQGAIDSGEINDDDFYSVINEETGEEERQLGDRAKDMQNAALDEFRFNGLINNLNTIIENIDKIDSIKKAAVKNKPSSVRNQKNNEDNSFEEEVKEEEQKEDKEQKEEKSEDQSQNQTIKKDIKEFITKKIEAITKVSNDSEMEDGQKRTYIQKVFNTLFSELHKQGIKYSSLPKKVDAALQRVARIYKLDKILNNKIEQSNSSTKKEDKKEKNTKSNTSGKSTTFDNTNESQIKDSQSSLNGNQFPRYVPSELRKGNVVTNTTSEQQNWFIDHNFNFQEILDKYVSKIFVKYKDKKASERPPIYYIHNNDDTVNKLVFIAFKYEDVKEDIPNVAEIITAQDGNKYVLIGTLGTDTTYRPETGDMFNAIYDNIYSEHQTDENASKEWFVDTEHTNRLKDISDGVLAKKLENDEKQDLRDLRDLLNSNERNPDGITVDSLQFVVVESTQDRYINYDPEKQEHYEIVKNDEDRKQKTGRVYVYGKSAKGMMVPIQLETLYFQDMQKSDENSLLGQDLTKTVNILANPNIPMNEKKSVIGDLTETLLFTPYVNNIHLNDENSQYYPNTIAITHNGISKVIIDFNKPTNTENNFDTLVDALFLLNPRINIKTSVLTNNPSYYLESRVLRTNIASLHTVGINPYLYPVNSELNYVENKQFKREFTPDSNTRIRKYLNGKPYYYDGKKFFNNTGEEITDQSIIDELTTIYTIASGNQPKIKLDNVTYYNVKGDYYVSNGKGGYEKASVDEVKKINAKLEYNKKKKEAEKQSKEIDKTKDEEDDFRIFDEGEQNEEKNKEISTDNKDNIGNKDNKDTKQPEKPKSYNKKISNSSQLNEKQQNENLGNLEKMSIFAQLLRNDRKFSKEIRNALTKKGKPAATPKEVMDSLKELNIDTLNKKPSEVLEILENCR